MVRYAVGYRSRAFVTFGKPIASTASIRTRGGRARHDAHVMIAIGRVYKGLPNQCRTAMRPRSHAASSGARRSVDRHAARCGANLGVQAVRRPSSAMDPLEARGIVVVDRGRIRVRDRNVLRFYAHSLDHLLESPSRRTH